MNFSHHKLLTGYIITTIIFHSVLHSFFFLLNRKERKREVKGRKRKVKEREKE